MTTIRITSLAGLALVAGLTLVGCAAEAPAASGSGSADSCQELNAQVRDINNAALNTLAGDIAADATGVVARFDGLVERAEALSGGAADADAITALADALAAAGEYAATVVPTAPESAEATADAEVRAGITAEVEAAATAVKESCSAE